jgi:hypothetical protein
MVSYQKKLESNDDNNGEPLSHILAGWYYIQDDQVTLIYSKWNHQPHTSRTRNTTVQCGFNLKSSVLSLYTIFEHKHTKN